MKFNMVKNNLKFVLLFIASFFVNHFGQNLSGTQNLNTQIDYSTISVTIGGNFIVNGSFPASSLERVDQFITRIYNETKSLYFAAAKDRNMLNQFTNDLQAYARRDILLQRGNGENLKLDLEKFRLTGDFTQNPYLKNDDVIIFPSVDLDRNFIEITGAVNRNERLPNNRIVPYRFQYVEGDKLQDAIQFAQGINSAYDNVTEVEISRLSYDGLNETIITVKITDDFNLMAGDRIRVLADETLKRNYKVLIEGEVNKPGYIYITKEKSTIKDVIEKAGGFKANADLDRAELVRGANIYNSPIFSQEFETIMMQRMSDIELEDSLSFIIDNKLRYSRGNLSIDFNHALENESPDSKFIVKDNDYIFIPEKINLVYVFGQVANPGYIEFIEGESFDYYIKKAGGIGKTARGEIYLIEGTTRSWIEVDEDSKYSIKPGDFIWLPKEPRRTFDYYLNRIGNIAGIIGGVATVVVLLIQLGK